MQKPILGSLILVLLLGCSGCGGKAAPPAAPPPSAPTSTGNPYYPLTAGTYQAWSITEIAAAHWNGEEVVIDTRKPEPNPRGSTFIYRYSTGKCAAFGDKTFFFSEWFFGDSPTPPATAPDRHNMLGDGIFTSPSGVEYIGEAVGYDTTGLPAEPKITTHPIAGETLTGTGVITHGCSDQSEMERLPWEYKTIRHWDSWQGFDDVWQTSLVERHANYPPIYYNWFFARHTATLQGGMVGFSCWSDQVDYYSCGNEYVGLH